MWGFLNGLYYLPHIFFGKPAGARSAAGVVIRVALTFLLTLIAWTFFRAKTLHAAITLLGAEFSPSIVANPLPLLRHLGLITPITFSAAAISFLLVLEYVQRDKGDALDVESRSVPTRWLAYASVVAIIVCFRYTGSALDFIYFQFSNAFPPNMDLASTQCPHWNCAVRRANVITYNASGYFERERDYHQEVADFFSRPNARAVFAGDSHVAQLENPLLAGNAYNIAWGGDSLREIYAKLRYLTWRHARIDTLFLTADAHMFGNGRLESSNRAFVDEYLLLTWSPYGFERGMPAAAMGTVPLFNDDFVQYLKKEVSVSFKREKPTVVRQDQQAWLSLTDAERDQEARRTGRRTTPESASTRSPSNGTNALRRWPANMAFASSRCCIPHTPAT